MSNIEMQVWEQFIEEQKKYAEGMQVEEVDKWVKESNVVEKTINGYHAVVYRSFTTGSLNGYIGVPITHPFYLKNYNNIDASVHGGLTYSDLGSNMWDKVFKKNYWYVGFDTAHSHDFSPLMHKVYKEFIGEVPSFMTKSTYRDMEYVSQEVDQLAEQVKAKKPTNNRINHKRLYKRLSKYKNTDRSFSYA